MWYYLKWMVCLNNTNNELCQIYSPSVRYKIETHTWPDLHLCLIGNIFLIYNVLQSKQYYQKHLLYFKQIHIRRQTKYGDNSFKRGSVESVVIDKILAVYIWPCYFSYPLLLLNWWFLDRTKRQINEYINEILN